MNLWHKVMSLFGVAYALVTYAPPNSNHRSWIFKVYKTRKIQIIKMRMYRSGEFSPMADYYVLLPSGKVQGTDYTTWQPLTKNLETFYEPN